MAISAKDIAALRKATNCGMLDCKKALIESDSDFDKAVEILRKRGQAKAVKKAGREANEGVVVATVKGNKAAITQLSCETDFVGNTDRFRDYASSLLEKTIAKDSNGEVTAELVEQEKDDLVTMIATIGENMQIVNAQSWTSEGQLQSYIHGNGRIGVIVDVEGEIDAAGLKSVCMHIAAFNPSYVDDSGVPAEDIEKEKAIFAEKAKGKPPEIADKIINGSVQKWFKDVCFVNQPWIMDDKLTFSQAYPKATVKRFVMCKIGK
ncbi:translation elongation factor Ts [Lentisphaera profundi]|uniref:Elongation factor Ts n=1 Tax=Lentisphaera profundi TaxID=1658616 RepID=A0ABY7VV87_9BACT|nr:translation elongation factor Ts [Lentisphaera profundi]WDE96654.1 translation elongation factor Ts [Lentisphaera profundi]